MSPQLSERAVAVLSGILTEPQSLVSAANDFQTQSHAEMLLVLMAILQGVTANTTSGDVLALGVYAAKDTCHRLGISEEMFEATVKKYLSVADKLRHHNPLAF